MILKLKKDITIVIVTHDMQQAALSFEDTAFLYLGELSESGPARKIVSGPMQSNRPNDYVTERFG